MYAARALVATLLGAFVGLERQWHGSAAGVRTFGAVALGACVYSLVSSHAPGAPDPTRIAAQIVSGIGFLGAGVILGAGGRIHGLTTAATLWSTAAIGMAVAWGMYVLAVLTALLVFALLSVHHVPGWRSSGSGPESDESRDVR
jgi:putative Mg2+ transporter-C (MgtC) family protein